jgi:hypothetical protein
LQLPPFRRQVIFALFVVILFVLIVLGLVYGLGSLWFAWWDGGLLRRILMTACTAAIVYGIVDLLKHRKFHM